MTLVPAEPRSEAELIVPDVPDLPQVEPAHFRPANPLALQPQQAPTHPVRILMLFGSVRERSYS
ncbi:MAG: hypothetical protein WBD51_13265, partial [Burkholderiaceae bacterium]